MAVHNGGPYLREAIDSVLGQTFADFEFVIVDDGSTDGSLEMIQAYDDPRIIVQRNGANIGLAHSLNRALDVSRGEYIGRQDADDRSSHERFALQMAALDQQPRLGGVASTVEFIDAAGNVTKRWVQPLANEDIQQELVRYSCFLHASATFRRIALLEIGSYDERLGAGEDYDMVLRLSERWELEGLPQTLYQYRWHNKMDSLTNADTQRHTADRARQTALERRLTLGRQLALGGAPEWTRRYSRREWADRFLWWAAGAREFGRSYALSYALVSLWLNPANRAWWAFMGGVARRKMGRP
jgi:glycosyltransferase involved in cell wall biosynthesis